MKKLIMVLLLLTGCRGGYNAPDVAMSAKFLTQEGTFDEKSFNPQYWQVLQDPTLDRLVALVETQNYEYLIAQEKINQLRAQYRFQTSQLFPQISGVGSIDRDRLTQTLTYSRFYGKPNQTQYQLGFDANWEIDLFGSQLAAKQSAFFSMMSQVERASYVKLTFVSELILQYVNLRTFQALEETYDKEIKVLSEIQDLSQSRFGAGLDDQTPALLNLARVQDKQATYERTQADIAKLIFLITDLTGQFPEKEFELLSHYTPLKASVPLIYPDIPSQIVLGRPDVASARFQLFSAQASLKKAYRDFFPQFSLTGLYGTLTNFPGLLMKKPSINWNITPGFNLTLIDFGALIAEKNAAKSEEKQALLLYENSLIQAFAELETALSGVKATDLQISSLEQELFTLREKTLDFKERFSVGLIEKADYLEAYYEELIIEEALLRAIADRFGFAISFYKALGLRL